MAEVRAAPRPGAGTGVGWVVEAPNELVRENCGAAAPAFNKEEDDGLDAELTEALGGDVRFAANPSILSKENWGFAAAVAVEEEEDKLSCGAELIGPDRLAEELTEDAVPPKLKPPEEDSEVVAGLVANCVLVPKLKPPLLREVEVEVGAVPAKDRPSPAVSPR